MTAQLLEHRGKVLLANRGVVIPEGGLARTAAEATSVAGGLSAVTVAVKAQVAAGRRGKAGAVLRVKRADAGRAAARLLGSEVAGLSVDAVLVEEWLEAERELYVGVTVDPRARRPVLLLGGDGGVDVEDGASEVVSVSWPISGGLQAAHVWRAADQAGLDSDTSARLVPFARAAAGVFRAERAQTVEINPVLDRGADGLVAADVRVVPDGPLVIGVGKTAIGVEAKRLGFDLVELDSGGNVGLITTGAGASMMLIDLLANASLKPINFCDLRTGSLRGDASRLLFVLDVLGSYRNLRLIVVNVFAGVTDLDEFSQLLIEAAEARPPAVPTIVRVEGRNAEAARARLTYHDFEVVETPEELVERAAARVLDSAALAGGAR